MVSLSDIVFGLRRWLLSDYTYFYSPKLAYIDQRNPVITHLRCLSADAIYLVLSFTSKAPSQSPPHSHKSTQHTFKSPPRLTPQRVVRSVDPHFTHLTCSVITLLGTAPFVWAVLGFVSSQNSFSVILSQSFIHPEVVFIGLIYWTLNKYVLWIEIVSIFVKIDNIHKCDTEIVFTK